MKTGAPVVGLLDCGGIRLQEASDALNAFGGIYRKQAFASGVIPQITGIFGTCGGGMALIPALADFTFMEADDGKLFVNAPNTLDGNHEIVAGFQSRETGLIDGVGTVEEVIGRIRQMVELLPSNNEDYLPYEECADDLNRSCPGLEECAKDTSSVLTRIADSRVFLER